MTAAVTTYALSFAQQRLWFADQLSPGSAAYNIYEAYRLRGPLDAERLHQSIVATVTRHEALRTTFHAHRGEPHQVIGPAEPAFDIVPVAESELPAAIAAAAHRPFALDREAPLRMSLLRLADDDHVLLAVVHHIVSDERSMTVFWRDLGTYYARETPEPLPIRYVDYAAWQRNWLSGDLLAREVAHWRESLAGAPLVLDIPTDRPRPSRQTDARGVVPFHLPAEVLADVRATARAAGVTTFMTSLAAFTALLAKVTRQNDLVVGTFAANRAMVEVEDVVGLFVNTLPLRLNAGDDPTFTDLLATVRRAATDGLRHEDVPFDRIVTAVRPPRDLSRNPLAQVAFQSLIPATNRLRLPGITAEPYELGQCGDPFDLRMAVRAGEGELHYAADLFTPETAAGLADRFVRVVAAATANPDTHLTHLP